MRNAFASEITEIAVADHRVVLLSGDIGNHLFDDFRDRCPGRFFNCGVAEANLMSMAAGMAMEGLRPVAYTIAPFVTTRCLEQIRVDVCYHDVPVVIVGTGSGLSYSSLGATHHSCEDIGFMRLLPGMTVVCPGDPIEARLAIRAALVHSGPVYLRLGKKGEPAVHASEPPFQMGRGIELRTGTDVCVLSTGNMLPVALEAAELMAAENRIDARVVSMHTVKPLDEALLQDAVERYPAIITVEEHSRIGGLGGAVAEWMADHGPFSIRLARIGTPDAFLHQAGGQDHARQIFELTASAIRDSAIAITATHLAR